MDDNTKAEMLLEGMKFTHFRHGNKGYVRDPETGKYLGEEFGDLHWGYSWYYRCVQQPRLVMIHHIMHPLSGDWTEWHVDGVKCDGAAEAIKRLNTTYKEEEA
jgi:hypothetical protein